MSYHIMLTKKVSDVRGQLQTQVQVMDFKAGRILYCTYCTLDELERNELPEELKEYIRGILLVIENGRWHYFGTVHR